MSSNNLSFNTIIEEICKEKNIKYKLLSKDWVTVLERDEKIRFISGYKFDLNNHGIGEVIDDKYALYEVLKSKNIPVIEHNILFSKSNKYDYAKNCNKYEIVKEYFMNNNENIVIKSNTGTCGTNVYHITEIDEIDSILDKLFIKSHSISYCPYYDIRNEYRAIILNDEIKFMYKKVKPIVYGDGVKSIRQLLIEFNSNYFKDKLLDEKYNRILEKDEVYRYNWQFNLSRGATAKKIEDNKLKDTLQKMALKAARTLNIKFASVDIIETDNDILILEINSGVMMENIMNIFEDGNSLVKKIYSDAIDEMFK